MTGIPGYKSAVNEFVTQAQTWVGQASAAAQASAAKLEAGTYTATDASADVMQATSLVVSGWLAWFAAFVDAATGMSTTPSSTSTITTDPIVTTASGNDRDVALAGALVSLKGDIIPATAVTCTPSKLLAGQTTFQLDVNAAGYPVGIYLGHVTLTPVNGAADTVPVTVNVS